MRTDKTAYKPYEDMILRYTAMIWCEGPVIKGTAEKIYEISSTALCLRRAYQLGSRAMAHRTYGRLERLFRPPFLPLSLPRRRGIHRQ